MELYPLTMCYFIERTQKCTKLFFNHYLLEFMPKRYPIVAHFRNETMEFRGAIIMKNFKIIYFYNEEKDIIWLVDLWDLRQDPRKLNMRARRIERKDYH